MKRQDFLGHVAWTGAGIAYSLSAGGIFEGRALAAAQRAPIDFVQISDSHIGFHQAANPDVAATLKAGVDAINALPQQPAFVVHTGDVTHLAKPEQFAMAQSILSTLKAPLVVLPGEHDMIGDRRAFFQAFRKETGGATWRSWNSGGVHFIVLVNVFDFERMGVLGTDQLSWLQRDLSGYPASTPVVVFTHVPLYALYPTWGWTTQDGTQALALLRRFDRVTVLNGHIHQVVHHQDGNMRFASANATAYPLPAPGGAPKPGPVRLPHDSLLHAIGYREVALAVDGSATLADHTLE